MNSRKGVSYVGSDAPGRESFSACMVLVLGAYASIFSPIFRTI